MTSLLTTIRAPFRVGDPRSFGGLTLVPLFHEVEPRLEYVGLDEALARGLRVTEATPEGIVETVEVHNPLDDRVLLYEGEELVGAKQDRIVARTVLVRPGSTAMIPVSCVERGRWAYRASHFASAPRAAYPALRRARRDAGQEGVWAEAAAKAARLDARSPTHAVEAVFVKRMATLERYLVAFPRHRGQIGAIACVGDRVACLDLVSRSDVWAALHAKLLRGYALDALEAPWDAPVPVRRIVRLLRALAPGRSGAPAAGLAGEELVVDGELVALTVYPPDGA